MDHDCPRHEQQSLPCRTGLPGRCCRKMAAQANCTNQTRPAPSDMDESLAKLRSEKPHEQSLPGSPGSFRASPGEAQVTCHRDVRLTMSPDTESLRRQEGPCCQWSLPAWAGSRRHWTEPAPCYWPPQSRRSCCCWGPAARSAPALHRWHWRFRHSQLPRVVMGLGHVRQGWPEGWVRIDGGAETWYLERDLGTSDAYVGRWGWDGKETRVGGWWLGWRKGGRHCGGCEP